MTSILKYLAWFIENSDVNVMSRIKRSKYRKSLSLCWCFLELYKIKHLYWHIKIFFWCTCAMLSFFSLNSLTQGLRPFAPRSAQDLQIRDVIKFSRQGGKLSQGIIRFIGHLPGRGDIYLGVELDKEGRSLFHFK